MSDKVAVLQKPQLRGLLHSTIKKHLLIGVGLSLVVGAVIKFAVADPRKRKYAEFYKNYDPDKDFEEMKSKGIFQSC